MNSFEQVVAVVKAIHSCDGMRGESVTWWVDDGAVRAEANCNDFFFWGCADGENIEVEDIPLLLACDSDLAALRTASGSKYHGWQVFTGLLFCGRKRGMRPQGAYYKHLPKATWPLFHSCGENRVVDAMNPIEAPNVNEGRK